MEDVKDNTNLVLLTVRVSSGQLKLLDEIVDCLKQNRSELVREALAVHLNVLYHRFKKVDATSVD